MIWSDDVRIERVINILCGEKLTNFNRLLKPCMCHNITTSCLKFTFSQVMNYEHDSSLQKNIQSGIFTQRLGGAFHYVPTSTSVSVKNLSRGSCVSSSQSLNFFSLFFTEKSRERLNKWEETCPNFS